MEIRLSKDALAAALAQVAGIVPRKTTMPILSNVLINAREDGSLTLRTTDLDVTIRVDTRAMVATPGAVTTNAKQIKAIVDAMPGPDVAIVERGPILRVVSGRAQFDLHTLAASEFPRPCEAKHGADLQIAGAVLRDLLDRTMYAMSSDETRNVLNGIDISATASGLAFAATDGHRLARVSRDVGENKALTRSVIAPRRGVRELRDLIADTEDVTLALSASHLVAKIPVATLSMRLIDGRFPDVEQVIPKAASRYVTIPAASLLACLKRVALVSVDRSTAVRIAIGDQRVALSAQSPDLGEASEEMDCDVDGDAMAIGVNARYLVDAVTACGGENVVLSFTDELSPMTVAKPVDASEIHVVMPMRI